MNILLIHQYFLEENDSGGSRWNEIAKVWIRGGNKVTVIAGMIHANKSEKRIEYKGRYFKRNMQGEVEVLRTHISESYNKNFVGRFWGYFSFMFSSLFGAILKLKGKYNVIIVTSPPLFVAFTGFVISRIKNIPLVFEVRDLWPESAIDTGVIKSRFIISVAFWVEAFIYRKATLIVVLTPAFKNILETQKGINPIKIVFIPNAADFNLSEEILNNFDRNSFRKEHELEGKVVFTYVGAHGIANHLIQIIDVAEQMQTEPVLFQLIGDGMNKKHLINEVAKRKLTNIKFVSSVSKSEIFKYVIASDVGMSILKKAETFKTVYSNKTFDYMCCKKPILMAIDGISRQLIEESDSGIYVEPENVNEFKRVINLFIQNPHLMEKKGLNGYNYAKVNFDREVLAIKYLNAISSLHKH